MHKNIIPDEIVESFKNMLNDPEVKKEVKEFIRASSLLTSEDLNRLFTI